jgi:phospholysine phosphohistidine inorganic pyrophosphate phosphatase
MDLGTVRGVLVDLDGTVYEDDRAIPGAADALALVRRAGLGVRFVTNTTRMPRSALAARLARWGVEARPEEIHTAPSAAAVWLRARGIERVSLCVTEATSEEFAGFALDDARPQAVVVGDLAHAWTFERLNRAFRHVLDGADLVALQKNRYWTTRDGLALDAGPFVVALEYATSRSATVLGKPSQEFFDTAARSLGLPLSALAMVGDDALADVHGAQAAGARGVLVRTGKFASDEAGRAAARPDATIGSLAELPALLGLG